jgi:peptidoglycan/LPS O-acetylase OafA/YrhL
LWGVLNPTDTAAPRPLVVASVATLAEALCFGVLAVVQALSFSSERSAMNWTTIAFFLLWGLMLAWCGLSLLRSRSWARSPIVMAQLVQLGVAWSFVKGDPARWEAAVAWGIAAVAVVVLVGLFHPKSIEHLASTDA